MNETEKLATKMKSNRLSAGSPRSHAIHTPDWVSFSVVLG